VSKPEFIRGRLVCINLASIRGNIRQYQGEGGIIMKYLSVLLFFLATSPAMAAQGFGQYEGQLAGRLIMVSAQVNVLSKSECRAHVTSAAEPKQVINNIVKEFPADAQPELRKVFDSIDLSEAAVFGNLKSVKNMVDIKVSREKLTRDQVCAYFATHLQNSYQDALKKWNSAVAAKKK
jgi:hypothetical protein